MISTSQDLDENFNFSPEISLICRRDFLNEADWKVPPGVNDMRYQPSKSLGSVFVANRPESITTFVYLKSYFYVY